MVKFRLNDFLFWYGSYSVTEIENTKRVIYNVRSNGALIRRLTTTVWDKDGTEIATMRNPHIANPYYRQQIILPNGNILGTIEPRITISKMMDNSKKVLEPYQGGRKFWRGAQLADVTFDGARYVAEAFWPGYRIITVTRDETVVMKLERSFIVSEWLDYLLLNPLMIEKSQYDVEFDSELDEEKYLLLALMVRQFYRHKYGKK